MGIDGIGKGGGIAPGAVDPSSQEVGGVEKSEREFSIDDVSGSAGAEPSESLQQLQRGEISLDEYLNLRVDGAVQHLEAKMSPEQLAFVREELKEQLQSDPVLSQLVRQATGHS